MHALWRGGADCGGRVLRAREGTAWAQGAGGRADPAGCLRRVKDALWHAPDENGRLALHLAMQREHWGSVELLLSRHEPDLRTIGHDGQRLVDMLRGTPAADAACVRQVIADEAYNELLAGAPPLAICGVHRGQGGVACRLLPVGQSGRDCCACQSETLCLPERQFW